MTLQEAIKGLEGEVMEAELEGADKAVAYLKLGIEALKRCQLQRQFPNNVIWETLPGETEE